MTYTEDVVVDDEEDTETEKEGGDGETAVPVTEQEGDSKNEGVKHTCMIPLLFARLLTLPAWCTSVP